MKKMLVITLICLLVGIVGIVVAYKKIEKTNSKITYSVKEGKLYVNNKESDIVEAEDYNVIGQIKDVLIVEASHIDTTNYVVDKDGTTIAVFLGKDATINSKVNNIYTKGNIIREKIKIDGNSLIIKSDNLGQDPEYNVCNSNSKSIVEYEEKFEYKDKSFKQVKTLKEITKEEYIKNNNITCK